MEYTLTYGGGTTLRTNGRLQFQGGSAVCPDGHVRELKRVATESASLDPRVPTAARSVRASVRHRGLTVSGSVYVPAHESGPAAVLEFVPDPGGANASAFASTVPAAAPTCARCECPHSACVCKRSSPNH